MSAAAFGGTMSGMRPQTMIGGGGTTLGRVQAQLQEGTMTAKIYGLLRDHKYDEVIQLLEQQLDTNFPRSRAAISLVAYSYYMKGEYAAAATYYDQLVRICPNIEEYQVYYAQSLYKAGQYDEAQRECSQIESEALQQRVTKLQASIAYERGEMNNTTACLDKHYGQDPDVTVLRGCVLFKEGRYAEALAKFTEAHGALGFKPDLAYNIALTHYQMKQYGPSLKHIGDVIERGIREHPELGIGSNTEGVEVRSVGNTQTLKDTALIEAFNLKAAIEYMMKNFSQAVEALTDMPPRSEEELDPVTLHNTALMNMDANPTEGFKKFNHLLQNPPFPPETFQNLLLFYCKYQCFDLAADVLAENPHLIVDYLSQNSQSLYDFLDGMITAQTSPAEAFRKFDVLAQRHVDHLRKLARKIQEAKEQVGGAEATIKKVLKEYDDALEEYICVLMAQAKIYWDIENYPMVEKLFRQSSEFTSEHEVWKLNVAHVFFMQETKFKEAIRYYSPVYEEHRDAVLDCSAIVLANLCVAYIMTVSNDKAEEIMRAIEQEETRKLQMHPDTQPLHLCIVNLVIGTLYCAKGNFEFGISRVIKSLEPYHRKLMPDTWFYAKRCFLALAASLSKHMVILKDSTFEEILQFFDAAAAQGERIPAALSVDPSRQDNSPKNTVRFEARILKRLFLKLRDAC
jgi:tetratricopeptide repeat protein 30